MNVRSPPIPAADEPARQGKPDRPLLGASIWPSNDRLGRKDVACVRESDGISVEGPCLALAIRPGIDLSMPPTKV